MEQILENIGNFSSRNCINYKISNKLTNFNTADIFDTLRSFNN